MTINRKGGKHKHMKRNRNVGEDRKNPKHIRRALSEMGEFYAKVIKPYGNKRFEVTIVDTTWKGKKITMTASLRGSKKMRKFERVTSDKIVMVTYDDTIGYLDIAHVYKDWEVSYIKKDKVEETGEFRIILDNVVKDNVFSFDFSLQNKEEKTKEDDPRSISISEITSIPSDDEEEEVNYQNVSHIKTSNKKDDLEELINSI